jgi:hypothetical protein
MLVTETATHHNRLSAHPGAQSSFDRDLSVFAGASLTLSAEGSSWGGIGTVTLRASTSFASGGQDLASYAAADRTTALSVIDRSAAINARPCTEV